MREPGSIFFFFFFVGLEGKSRQHGRKERHLPGLRFGEYTRRLGLDSLNSEDLVRRKKELIEGAVIKGRDMVG